jgi:ATP-dependent RNA helicase DDX41
LSEEERTPRLGPQSGKSLLEQAQELKKEAALNQETPEDRARREEAKLLHALENRKKLMTDQELAKGVVYTDALRTAWRPPRHIREMDDAACEAVRAKWHIVVEGEGIPPPIKSFADMRFPPAVLAQLKAKGIARPTPIQIQGLPVALSGRDMIGIAFTGSGKTLVFALPMVMRGLEAELKLPLVEKEGPVALVVVPSRELASQIYEVCRETAAALHRDGSPEVRVLLCIGGINMAEQAQVLRRGVHIVVATPGRLKDMLEKKKLNLDVCQYAHTRHPRRG